ncbi:hypothetical protein PAMP_003993 [Pampus punctatissimus]
MEVNLSGVKQSKGVWLVKVRFSLDEELAAVGEKEASLQVPRDHPFTMHTVGGQTMAVFSQSDKGKGPAGFLEDSRTTSVFGCKTKP